MPQPVALKLPINVPLKIMMAPGPSNCSQRVLNALKYPILGNLHPETFKIMDDVKYGIRYMFQTNNPLTLCVSTSGHGGMEAVLCNLLEDREIVLIGVTGIWGQRAGDMAVRYGADVRYLSSVLSESLSLDEIRDSFEFHKPKVFFITQGDSSTGVLQSLKEISEICQSFDCLLVVDAVASLGGTEFLMDKWKNDAVYTGTQKVLGAPPGITPISFSQRSVKKIITLLLGDFWGFFFSFIEFFCFRYSLELTGGLGPTVGQVFRIAVMGMNANIENVDFTLFVLKEAIQITSKFSFKK